MIKRIPNFIQAYGVYIVCAGIAMLCLLGLYVVAAFFAKVLGVDIISLPIMLIMGGVAFALTGIPAIFMEDGKP